MKVHTPEQAKELRKIIRDTIQICITNIRECRADRSCPTLLGQGFTIAVREGTSCICKENGGYSFRGSWNRNTIYFTQERAHRVLASIQDHPLARENRLVVTHHNDLRDRAEAIATTLLKTYFPKRNFKG